MAERCNRRRFIVAAATTGVFGLAGCSQSADESEGEPTSDAESSQGENDATTTGDGPETVSPTAASAARGTGSFPTFLTDGSRSASTDTAAGPSSDLGFAWTWGVSYTTDTPSIEQYTVVDGTVFGAGYDTLVALDADGEQLWSHDTSVKMGPVVVDDQVLTVSRNDQLASLDASSGDRNWVRPVPDDVSPDHFLTAADGLVYYSGTKSYDEHVVGAFDVEQEASAWQTETLSPPTFGQTGITDPVVADGVVYVAGDADDDIIAVDAATGEQVWTTSVEHRPTKLVAAGETLYAVQTATYASESSTVTALDTANGSSRWVNDADYSSSTLELSKFAADADTVFYPVDGGYAAFAADSGEQRWTYQLTDGASGGAVVSTDYLYVPSRNGLHVVDRTSGDQHALFETDRSLSGLSVVGSRLYSLVRQRGIGAIEAGVESS